MRTNPPGSTISVPPYVSLFPVFLAHSSKLPYSTYPAPPTMNTIPSLNAMRLDLPPEAPPVGAPTPEIPRPALGFLGARGSRKRYSSVSWRDWFDATDESISASVNLVTANNLLAGRKFFTPLIRFSSPPSLSRSVSCGRMLSSEGNLIDKIAVTVSYPVSKGTEPFEQLSTRGTTQCRSGSPTNSTRNRHP